MKEERSGLMSRYSGAATDSCFPCSVEHEMASENDGCV